MSDEQAQKKKLSLDLVLSKRMITFETMSRSYSRSKILKQIWCFAHLFVTLHPMMSHSTAGGSPSGVHWKQFIADCNATLLPLGGRMWNWVRLPIRNPVFPQSPRQPLYKEKLRILPKLRKNERNAKGKFTFLFIFEQKMQLMCIKNYQKKKWWFF